MHVCMKCVSGTCMYACHVWNPEEVPHALISHSGPYASHWTWSEAGSRQAK